MPFLQCRLHLFLVPNFTISLGRRELLKEEWVELVISYCQDAPHSSFGSVYLQHKLPLQVRGL